MTPRTPPQKGLALTEALVASAVLGIGMMGAVQMGLQGLQTATDTRQRATAHGLALDAMDCHLSRRPVCPMNDNTTAQGITFTRQVELAPRVGLGLVDITVTVHWQSAARAGTAGKSKPVVLRSSRSSVPLWVGVSLP
jgi:Tfp pilus assembly protein PilV